MPQGSQPTIAIHDADSGADYALVVPKKGAHRTAVARATSVLDGLGYKRLAIKSDQEPSLLALISAIRLAWNGEAVPEESPAYCAASNGAAERSVRSIKEQREAMLLGL